MIVCFMGRRGEVVVDVCIYAEAMPQSTIGWVRDGGGVCGRAARMRSVKAEAPVGLRSASEVLPL